MYLFTQDYPRNLFHPKWSGPYKIVTKISELNYKIAGQDGKTQIVHVNRLKAAHDPSVWKLKPSHKAWRKPYERPVTTREEEQEEDEIRIGPFLLLSETPLKARTPPNQSFSSPPTTPQTADTPLSEQSDPTYHPPETPWTRRELQTTHTEPPLTRSRARITSQ